ncbi:hypothetical protein FRC02_000911 [Tulasnella sp. 418]|nr:hypothetical protein FRC02_000911 [Tulasnella sp. 418]
MPHSRPSHGHIGSEKEEAITRYLDPDVASVQNNSTDTNITRFDGCDEIRNRLENLSNAITQVLTWPEDSLLNAVNNTGPSG